MMNFAKLFVLVLVALVGTGCVGGVQVRAEIARLQAENAALRERAPADASSAALPRQPATPTALIPPPAQPQPLSMPENVGWLHQPPRGCETGPFAVRLENRTGAYLKVLVNGKELVVRGAGGVLPHLPPRTTAHICLAVLGRNSFAGVKYLPRAGVLQPVGQPFSFSQNFRPNATNGAGPYNVVVLDDYRTSMQVN